MDNKHKLIIELMEQLQGEMEMSSEDFGDRLGRKRPEPKVEIGMSEEEHEDMPMEEEESCSPDESLKKRLMNLRG